MVSQTLFIGATLLLALQRVWEMRLSARHEAALRSRGAREYGAGHFWVMKTLHGLWFVALLAEVFLLERAYQWPLTIGAAVLVVCGQALRYAAIRALGTRWTVRVFVLPNADPVQSGLFRWIRHPNYVGVLLEIVAFPLLHGAFLTSLLFGVLHALLLVHRIRTEEAALALHNRYAEVFDGRPRFLPVGR